MTRRMSGIDVSALRASNTLECPVPGPHGPGRGCASPSGLNHSDQGPDLSRQDAILAVGWRASSFSTASLRIIAALAIAIGCLCNRDCIAGLATFADEPAAAESPTAEAATDNVAQATDQPAARRFAVIICGHPGDADHVEMFQGSVDKIRMGLAAHYQFAPENIHVFIGDEESNEAEEEQPAVASSATETDVSTVESSVTTDSPGTAASASVTPATKEIIAFELQSLKTQITENDSLFVIVIGHTHFENNLAWLNLHGPDLQQKEFAAMFEGIGAKEQVFFITNPCSGYYIRPLSRPGRTIITATESDLEVNETLCPHVLADMLSAAPLAEWDQDSDKHLSLFEFYIALCRGVAGRYIDETLIATEHPQLDDNADGKGSELQLHYLTEDQGGLPKNRQRQKLTEGRDGMAASKLKLASF